jgi:hypothetical protein
MPYTPTRLYHAQPGTSTTLLYTATGGVIVKQIIVANTTATAETITIGLGPTGAALAAANHILSGVTVPPYSTLTFDLSLVMANTDVLRGLQTDSATALTVSISGVTF